MSWVYLQDPPQLLLALLVGDQVDLEMRQKSLSPTSASRRPLFSSVILSTDRLSLLKLADDVLRLFELSFPALLRTLLLVLFPL